MEKRNESTTDVKFGLKSFLTVCGILLAIMIFVGILTFVIPAGQYLTDSDGKIIPDSFHHIESQTRLPVYRWFSAPIEALFIGEGNVTIIQIIAILLALGGTFKVLDRTGGLSAIVRVLVDKFYHKRYGMIWIITLFMMLLASCFGLQEELLILFPFFLSFAKAMNWSKTQAISMILITTGVGFTAALFNPFTVGISSGLAGVSLADGLLYRILILAVLYVVTSLYLVHSAKKDEQKTSDAEKTSFVPLSDEERAQYGRLALSTSLLFLAVLVVIVVFSVVPFLADLGLGMVAMTLTFVVGAFALGKTTLGSLKKSLLYFLSGAKDTSPAIVIILLAFSVKYIAENGDILHTLFYYCHAFISAQSPYVAVILLYVLVLILEFFIPGSTSKALLIIPLLTLAPLPGISANIIILAFLFGDGYTNVLYPTCGTLMVGLSLAEVGFVSWVKKTALFQLLLFVISTLFLLFAVYIGL
ncbi:MAG: hypothetical protein J6K61_02705 [Clostridia bacterium]|nr:hypothetical protein [Clostridia bacterium]